METIIYQGREIQATKVNYISGAITTSTVDHEGDEDLFRDQAGRYYLRRQLSRLDSEGECRPASERTLVHRINVNAAILWATTRLNSETLDLRADAAKLLMEGRGYTDPHPSHLSAEQRAMVSDPDRFAKQREPGSHRFTFDYSASRWLAARRHTVELTDEQMQRARELAATFGLELTAFLRGLVDRNDLPGQRCYSDAKVYNLLQAEHIGFVCTDVAMAQRIERAAQSRGESVEEWVAHALGGDVDMREECMLLHPTTGDLLDTDYEELYTEVKCDILTAPLGQEDERLWKLSIGKERVNFGVFLRPEQVERVEYPHMVWDDDENRDVPCVLIPLDPEGNPVLRVGSRYVEPGKAIPRAQAASQAAPGFADLDDNARELLAKHLAENPELDARDVLNGAVTFLLSDEVNYTTDAVNEARDRRVAQEAAGKHHVALCALLDDEAAALVRRYLKVSPWEFTAADIINACVVHALKQAFDNVATVALEGELDAEEYDDSGWGYVEEDIVAATLRRTDKEAVDQRSDWSKQDAEAELASEMTEYSAGLNKVRSELNLPPRGSRGANPNPADVALLAASAPEVEHPAPPPAEGDEHLPVEEHVDELEKGTSTPDGEEGK